MTGKEFHCNKCVILGLLLTKVGTIPLITQGFTKPIFIGCMIRKIGGA